MTTTRTFIKGAQTLKLAMLSLCFGSAMAFAQQEMDAQALVSSLKKGDKITLFNVANRVQSSAGASKVQESAESKRILFTQAPSDAVTSLGATFYKGYKFDNEVFRSAANQDLIYNTYDVCFVAVISNSPEITRSEIMNSLKECDPGFM